MKKSSSLKDQGTPWGYTPQPDENYVQAILSIAKKHGVKITDKMIQDELKAKEKTEDEQEDAWDPVKRKKILKALKEIRGIWADDKDFDKRQKERHEIEIKAAEEMKKAW